jgi:hypothetical protein
MSLAEKLEILKKAGVSEDALCDAIHDLGEEGPSALHPYVAPFLMNPSPLVRHMALSVLGFHWKIPQYSEKYADLLRMGPDEDVRREAAAVLGTVLRGSRDKIVARLLINK